MRTHLLVCLALPFLIPAPALAWGCEGHQIVALIARAHLTAAASAAVDKMLADSPGDPALAHYCKDRSSDPMADAASWADDVRNTNKTGAWHYVDIPMTVPTGTTLEAWCAPVGAAVEGQDRTGCVTSVIAFQWAVLRDASRSAADRADALRYLVHFVADMHQPLHDSDNDDRGGNCTSIRFFADDKPSNLHSIWDTKLIQHDLQKKNLSPAAYAHALDLQFADQWNAWGSPKIDVESWAWEAHTVALTATYGDLLPAIPMEKPTPQTDCDAERAKVTALHIAIGDMYFDQTIPDVERQLARAGYRLAALLNTTFTTASSAAPLPL